MNTDSYFEIGTTHIVCQDYALSGSYKDLCYGIVSDGCSSAHHSEIGAQILCHVASYYLSLYYDLFKDQTDLKTLTTLLGNSILTRADELRKLYVIDRAALQATLLISAVIAGKAYVFAWGDGVIIQKYKDAVEVIEIEYPETNAPFYLSSSVEAYVTKFGDKRKVAHRYYSLGCREANNMTENIFDTPFSLELNELPELIVLSSDGISQYQTEKKSGYVDTAIMVPQIIDYPNLKGPFVQRTMNFLKRDLLRKGWSHADDVGMAAINLLKD